MSKRDQIVDRLLFDRHITPEEAEVLRGASTPWPWAWPEAPVYPNPFEVDPHIYKPSPNTGQICLFEEAAKRGETGPLSLSCPCPRCTLRCSVET